METFFGFNDYTDSDEVLFLCIVRNPFNWIDSLFKFKYHLANPIRADINKYLNDTFWSYDFAKKKEIMDDRNIYTQERYKNIFELRYTKLKYLIEDLPTKVNNVILIKYEELEDYESLLNKVKNLGIICKNNYPTNITKYCKGGRTINKYIPISKDLILNNPNFDKYKHYDILLNYI